MPLRALDQVGQVEWFARDVLPAVRALAEDAQP
jgi:hypothetical protein